MCPERSATSAYHRVCHAGRSVRLDFMADTTLSKEGTWSNNSLHSKETKIFTYFSETKIKQNSYT